MADRLALYCQSDPALLPEILSNAWLPNEIADLGHARAQVSSDYAIIEMGGGFHHFGYKLGRDDEKSSPDSNIWVLFTYSEDGRDCRLTEVALTPSDRLERNQIIELVSTGYDRRIEAHPHDDLAYKGEMQMFLRYGHLAEVKLTCEQWALARPDYWLPHSTLAHVRSRLNESNVAEVEFRAWVNAHASFPNFIYLFLFNMREGHVKAALDALRQSLQQPFVETFNSDGNKFYLGYNGATYAFMEGEYDLALALCDKMLAKHDQDSSWLRKVWKMRAATVFMQGSTDEALDCMGKVKNYTDPKWLGTSPEDQCTDSCLLKAIKESNYDFVRSFPNWMNEWDTWFTPFHSDEAGFSNRDFLLAPYPSAWIEQIAKPNTEPGKP
ncbi:hypothetical protein JXQ70_16905 [bacterium]|nr:hypothetical protein [bacterium]